MATTTQGQGWEGAGASVRGASHSRSGQVNQDAFSWRYRDSNAGFTGVLAVADGHGSARSFRSELGAKFAVRIATQILEEFADGFHGNENLAAIQRTSEVDLPKKIVHLWREAVADDLRGTPFSLEDFGPLDTAGRKAVEELPPIAYGTTLLAVLLTDRYVLYSQVGDGDIITVSESGQACRPLQKDDRLLANETTSLCSLGAEGDPRRSPGGPAGAWSEFRMRFDPSTQTPPALILVSTDGYANSFRSEGDFLKVGPDLLQIIRAEGLDHVRDKLESWLLEASRTGSGDDVTLGLICRKDVVKRQGPELTPSSCLSSSSAASASSALEHTAERKASNQWWNPLRFWRK